MALKILVCPIDWGLGHATRDVPLISILHDAGHEVFIGTTKSNAAFFANEIPDIPQIEFPTYRIHYSSISVGLSIVLQLPKFFVKYWQEILLMKKLQKRYSFDVVISDNRFGVRHKEALSLFISHQVNIQLGEIWQLFKPLVNKLNRFFTGRFDQLIIPDFKSGLLTGNLSETKELSLPYSFIQPLSRFAKIVKGTIKFDILILNSGPEPKRSIFEKKIIEQAKKSGLQVAYAGGKLDGTEKSTKSLTIFSYANTQELNVLINQSKHIICRSGYSTIMDLIALNRTAFIVPTPGQWEQEYIAKHLINKGFFIGSSENDFELVKAYEQLCAFNAKLPEIDKTAQRNQMLKMLDMANKTPKPSKNPA